MNKELKVIDVLIIGSGIAGAAAAIEVARSNPMTKVLVLTRTPSPNESNTRYAQGGIIAKGGPDLVSDILKSGDGIGYPDAAETLADEGPKEVDKILRKLSSVPFDTEQDGKFAFALEGGHSESRVAFVADYTGRSIQEHLTKTLQSPKNIEILTDITAIDLLTLSHHSSNYQKKYLPETCVGIYGFDQKTGKVMRILAKKTVLATGGTGQIFAFTTNPKGARGDGLAMAERAGARLLGLEFEQFHPTALKINGAPPFLISEAVRGEGARLTNEKGEPFMQKYYPELEKPDLTTRDKVSRAIFTEMLKSGTSNVYLDLKSYISREEILRHFPMIRETCLSYGIDITKDLIPVSPAAHYCCGGVQTDLWGQTSIDNLYAVGEVANTGLHGGNRLASTSLLEGLVFGTRAGKKIKETIGELMVKPVEILPWEDKGHFTPDAAIIAADMATVRNIMWNMVGLVRKTHSLKRAISDLIHLEDTVTRFYREAILTDELLGLRNMVLVALLTARAALANQVSIGCHYRES